MYTILKQMNTLKTVTPAKGVTILSKLRTPFQEEIEKLLLVWVYEKQLTEKFQEIKTFPTINIALCLLAYNNHSFPMWDLDDNIYFQVCVCVSMFVDF